MKKIGQERPSGPGGRIRLGVAAALASIGLLGACDDGSIPPEALPFGQVGHIEVRLEVPGPFRPDAGEIVQHLVWESTGDWSFTESISYRGVLGDADRRIGTSDVRLVREYADLIRQANRSAGLQLLDVPSLLEDPDPECGTFTRVTVRIFDAARADSASWTRCAEGSLGNPNPLTTKGAFPNPETAARVPQVALLATGRTLGDAARYTFTGSVPFATLDRGGDTPVGLSQPKVIRDTTEWRAFWTRHAPTRSRPEVDFSVDMVVVGITGVRNEAGDSVEVRRILPVDVGTLIHVVEREPGDFCSPASFRHTPFHVVVAPRTPEPVTFADIGRDLVSCL